MLCSSSHPHVCVPVFMSWLSARCRDNSEASGSVCVMSHPISASILGPVFGNQDQFVGLAIFVDTFRNDLHGMDVSVCVLCHWPACFSAGPVFSDYARFHGLAVFLDTYSNDDATDVSGGSGLIRRHADLFSFEFSRRTGMSSESTSTLGAFKLILLIFTYLSRQPQS